MATKIALMGAGGKMGMRITNNLKDLNKYEMAYVEVSEQGIANLKGIGLDVTPEADAIKDADAVILALPDKLIGKITEGLIPKLNPGTIVIGLDPAAAYAEVMPMREDLTYFVSHPCHPPVFNEETTPEGRTDWFGGVHAAQSIVSALHQGPEEHFAVGEEIAKDMYGPIIRSHRITVEQMAILEPALVETFAATLVSAMKEALEEAVAMGVPREAAEDFFYGHIRIEIAILFGLAGFPFSDGAKLAVEKAKDKIFKPDWKENIMSLSALKHSVAEITDSVKG